MECRRMLTIGEAIDDMEAYTKLTDDVILQIMRSLDEKLKVSSEILKRVQKRQFYKYIGQARSKVGLLISFISDTFEKKSVSIYMFFQSRFRVLLRVKLFFMG